MDLGRFTTDTKLEEDGVWIDLDETSKIKIARMGNKTYRKVFKKYATAHKIAIRNNTLPDEKQTEIMCRALSEAVWLDSEGLTLRKVPFEHTVENAFDVLMDKTLKDFREFIVESASDMDNYRAQVEEEGLKNLESSSDGA